MQAREGKSTVREGGQAALPQHRERRVVPLLLLLLLLLLFLLCWGPSVGSWCPCLDWQHSSWQAPPLPSLADVPRVSLVGEEVERQSPMSPWWWPPIPDETFHCRCSYFLSLTLCTNLVNQWSLWGTDWREGSVGWIRGLYLSWPAFLQMICLILKKTICKTVQMSHTMEV